MLPVTKHTTGHCFPWLNIPCFYKASCGSFLSSPPQWLVWLWLPGDRLHPLSPDTFSAWFDGVYYTVILVMCPQRCYHLWCRSSPLVTICWVQTLSGLLCSHNAPRPLWGSFFSVWTHICVCDATARQMSTQSSSKDNFILFALADVPIFWLSISCYMFSW